MATRVILERQANRLRKDIESMENHNDGSIKWVDDLRELIAELDEVEARMTECEEE